MSNLKNYNEIEWGRRVGTYNGNSVPKLQTRGTDEWELTLNKTHKDGVDNYGNSVISYPEELGQIGANERLQNFVLFDIYDTGGQRLQDEKSEENLVNLQDLENLGGNFFRETFGFGGTGATSDIAALSSGSPEDLARIVAAFGFIGLLASGNFAGFASGAIAGLGIQAFAGKFLSNVIANKKEFSDSGYVDDLIAGKTLESYNSSALGLANKTQRIGLSIALPMPAQINSNYGMEYEDTDFSAMGTMMAGIRAYSSPDDNQAINSEFTQSEIKRKLGSVNFSVVDSLAKIVGSDQVNLNQFFQASLREAPNRFSEKTFKGVERRKFSFEWDFSPRSEKDAKIIASIIYAFKKYSHPALTKGGIYLDYPAQFRIGFFNKLQENDYLFKIGLCACTKCDVTYGGDELGFLREIRSLNGDTSSGLNKAVGAPANTVKLELEFSELELLTRQRIQAGY